MVQSGTSRTRWHASSSDLSIALSVSASRSLRSAMSNRLRRHWHSLSFVVTAPFSMSTASINEQKSPTASDADSSLVFVTARSCSSAATRSVASPSSAAVASRSREASSNAARAATSAASRPSSPRARTTAASARRDSARPEAAMASFASRRAAEALAFTDSVNCRIIAATEDGPPWRWAASGCGAAPSRAALTSSSFSRSTLSSISRSSRILLSVAAVLCTKASTKRRPLSFSFRSKSSLAPSRSLTRASSSSTLPLDVTTGSAGEGAAAPCATSIALAHSSSRTRASRSSTCGELAPDAAPIGSEVPGRSPPGRTTKEP
mmetsp:Transcript_50885/g.143243  ORF Transcript_50885/g.143243 Transcript_50885/m.143243 type:complete len:321 (-) Transcript_50885:115-1077(-)